MGIDDESGLWVCSPDAGEVQRYNKEGKISHRLSFPGDSPISCTIGGPDGQTLYITVTSGMGSPEELFENIKAGRVKTAVWEAHVPFTCEKARP